MSNTNWHILYINMEGDKDREAALKQRIQFYFDGESVDLERIPGVSINTEDALEIVDMEYHEEKRMTLGEIGCALAHVNAWKRVVELGHPCIILEDDVQSLNHNFLRDLNKIYSVPAMIYKPEFIYLGRQPHFYDQESSLSDEFRIPMFSWLLHAYWLTPSGAQKLLDTGFQRNVSVVDDYVPVMLGHGPNMKFAKNYESHPKLKALAVERALFWQLDPIGPQRAINSRTVNSAFLTNSKRSALEERYGFVTVASDQSNPGFKLLDTSLGQNGWAYSSALGANSGWTDPMGARGGAGKLLLMKEWIRHLESLNTDPETIIIFADGYDMFCQESEIDVIAKFHHIEEEGKVVFAAETNLWPVRENGPKAVEGDFLNSGGYIGRFKNVARLFQYIRTDTDDDQQYFQEVWLKHPDWIKLDHYRNIFLCMSDGGDLEVVDGCVHELGSKERPSFVHGNGGEDVKKKWKGYAEIYTQSHSPEWIGPRPTFW